MNKQPLLIMLVCFIIGILMEDQFRWSENWVVGLLVFSMLLLLLIFTKNFWIQKYKSILLGFFFFSVGVFSHAIQNPAFLQKSNFPEFTGKQSIVFQLNKKLNSNEKYRRYEASVLKIQNFDKKEILPFNTVISVPKENPSLDFKNFYQTEMFLNNVKSPKNDFQFDYAKYLARKDIFYQGFANAEILSAPKKSISFPDQIREKRLEVLQNIDHSTLQPNTKEFLKGIILADRTDMDAETVSDFSKSGLVHFLAISGTHMVIIFWLVLFFLKNIFPTKYRKIPIVLSLVFIWVFAIFIDYGSSVMRSCIMISAYYIFVLLQRKPDLLHAMALAGFAILIFDTNQIFDVGFQLSFLAVLGIYWLNQPILRYLPKPKNNFQNFLVNIPSVSFSAQIATLPLVLYYFHQYSLTSILANLFIIPFSEIIIIFSLLMTILLGFNLNFSWLNWLYDGVVSILLKIIHWFAGVDFVFVKNIPMSIWEVAVLFIAIYFLRNVLVKKDVKSILKFSYLLLAFFALRIGLNFYNYQKSEVLVAQYFKQKVLLVKEKGKATFFINEKANSEKIEKSLVEPYLSSRRISEFSFGFLPENTDVAVVDGKEYFLK